MIEIQKDPREVKKRFRCTTCDCEFTAGYEDTEKFAYSYIVRCPVCGGSIEWQYGEDVDPIIIENK